MNSSDTPNNAFIKIVNNYTELIKTVAAVEHSRLAKSSHMVDYAESVNIGITAVYVLLSADPDAKYTDAYIATAVKWAIRNEFRKRFKWYSCKYLSKDYEKEDCNNEELNRNHIREAIYETILSTDELTEINKPIQIEDSGYTPEQRIEFIEISKAVFEAMKTLPPKEKIVLEMRFYRNKKIKEIATELTVTPSRISRIIQTGLDKIKLKLQDNELI